MTIMVTSATSPERYVTGAKDKNLNRDQRSFELIIWFPMRGQLSHNRMFGRGRGGGVMTIVNADDDIMLLMSTDRGVKARKKKFVRFRRNRITILLLRNNVLFIQVEKKAVDVLKQMEHPLCATSDTTKRYDGTAIRYGPGWDAARGQKAVGCPRGNITGGGGGGSGREVTDKRESYKIGCATRERGEGRMVRGYNVREGTVVLVGARGAPRSVPTPFCSFRGCDRLTRRARRLETGAARRGGGLGDGEPQIRICRHLPAAPQPNPPLSTIEESRTRLIEISLLKEKVTSRLSRACLSIVEDLDASYRSGVRTVGRSVGLMLKALSLEARTRGKDRRRKLSPRFPSPLSRRASVKVCVISREPNFPSTESVTDQRRRKNQNERVDGRFDSVRRMDADCMSQTALRIRGMLNNAYQAERPKSTMEQSVENGGRLYRRPVVNDVHPPCVCNDAKLFLASLSAAAGLGSTR
ncbi:hypothetical protein DBV15_08168 [Temnothorax longispinosus]|uniref:Uncharacterized protein n=1 Tax=Temnothorax longispinosus TaxID=300112 RepID=A0A4S2K9R1_9HYME|nr:hypothetical protein DBV15_08168 [Temnothorax longispinosus]